MICRFGIRLLVRDRLEIARKMAALERRFLRGEMCRVRVGKKYIKDTPMLTHDQQAKTASGLRKYSNSNEIQCTPKLRSVRLRILLLYLTYKILNSEIEWEFGALFEPVSAYWGAGTFFCFVHVYNIDPAWPQGDCSSRSSCPAHTCGSPGPRFGLTIQRICPLTGDHQDQGLVWLLNWFVHYRGPLRPRFGLAIQLGTTRTKVWMAI